MGWDERWKNLDTPWDAGAPSPTVVAFAADPNCPKGRVLVPGCGRGWDAFALASSTRSVVALDLAPSVRGPFEDARASKGLTDDDVSLIVGDFFDDAAVAGPFDLIWDYTFLCALPLEMRSAWATRMAQLVRPGGELACLIFPVMEAEEGYEGPPWPLDPEAVTSLLAPSFARESLAPAAKSKGSRTGKEWFARFRRTE
ncbi:MAG: methyltransferase domain-containing protein [Myxococcota bacterium]